MTNIGKIIQLHYKKKKGILFYIHIWKTILEFWGCPMLSRDEEQVFVGNLIWYGLLAGYFSSICQNKKCTIYDLASLLLIFYYLEINYVYVQKW